MGNKNEIILEQPSNEDVAYLKQSFHDKQAKIIEMEDLLTEKEKQLIAKDQEINRLTAKGLKVMGENQLLSSSERIAEMTAMLEFEKAKMKYELDLAKQFSDSKAFPKLNAEQIYVIMKCGEEMGLKPIQALQTLYIINGAVKPFGDKMIAHVTRNGYKIEYTEESVDGVTVTVTKGDETYIEKATAKEVSAGQAYKFSPANKLRFHAIRKVIVFHIPHIFGSVADSFTEEFTEWQEDQKAIPQQIKNEIEKEKNPLFAKVDECQTIEELEALGNSNKKEFTGNVKLKLHAGKKAMALKNENE